MNFVTNSNNRKEHSLAIFCDLRKAFNAVDHYILIKNLKKLGIHGTELRWFEDYLCNRQQVVMVNGASSSLLSYDSWGSTGFNSWSPVVPNIFIH